MTEIIKKGREHCIYPIKGITKEELVFTCTSCGCIFGTDEYNINTERRLGGSTWYTTRCPWCGNRNSQ